jgi:hypothetical protein
MGIDPNPVACGQPYAVTVTTKNTGTAYWTVHDVEGALERFDATGDRRVDSGFARPSAFVRPGADVALSVQLTAPTSPGSYALQFRMFRKLAEPDVIVIGEKEFPVDKKAFGGQSEGTLFVECGPATAFRVTIPAKVNAGQTASCADHDTCGQVAISGKGRKLERL